MASKSVVTGTLKNASIFAAASMLEKAVGFIMLPLYAHLLGSEGYGIIGMIEVVNSVLGIFVSYGIASAVNRFYFEKKSETERNVLMSTAMFTMLLICAGVCFPAIAFNKPIAFMAFGEDGLGLYIVLSVSSFMIETTTRPAMEYLLIRQKSVLVSILSFFRFLLAVTLNICLIVILRLGVLGVLYSSLVTALTFFLIYNGYTLSKTGLHFNKKDAREILQYSLPLIPGYIAMFVRTNADRIILRTFLGLAEIGVYSMVMKFSMLLGLFIHDPFMKTWGPKRMEICEDPDGPNTIADVVTTHLTLMLFAALILSLEIPLIIKIMTPPEFWITAVVGFYAVFGRFCFNTYYHLMFGLLYGKKTLKISAIQTITALISLPLYILFIKYQGIKGAFLAALLTYLFMCIISHYYANKYYKIPYEWRKIVISTISAVILFMLINPINFDHFYIGEAIKSNVLPSLNRILIFLNLDGFKDGKLILIVNDSFQILLEAFFKIILGLSYPVVLILFKVIPKETLNSVLAYLKKLMNGLRVRKNINTL